VVYQLQLLRTTGFCFYKRYTNLSTLNRVLFGLLGYSILRTIYLNIIIYLYYFPNLKIFIADSFNIFIVFLKIFTLNIKPIWSYKNNMTERCSCAKYFSFTPFKICLVFILGAMLFTKLHLIYALFWRGNIYCLLVETIDDVQRMGSDENSSKQTYSSNLFTIL